MKCHSITIGRAQTGIVSRAKDALVFCGDEIRQLTVKRATSFNTVQLPVKDATSTYSPLKGACSPVFESATGCIYFVQGHSIKRLDDCNIVSLVAGGGSGRKDGRGGDARFERIAALAVDSHGGIYAADGAFIRKLTVWQTGGDALECIVTTLDRATPPGGGPWTSLTYDCLRDELVASTSTVICRAPVSSGVMTTVAGAAGAPVGHDSVDGCGAAARFHSISCMATSGDGRVYIIDGSCLREMSCPGNHVHTLVPNWHEANGATCMAITPSGWLAVCGHSWSLAICGPGFQPRVYGTAEPAVPAPKLVKYLTAPAPDSSSTDTDEHAGSPAASSPGPGPMLTIRVGDRAFVAHRALLSDRCDYFRQLLSSEGFADGGDAAEVALADADADVFGALLCYMYWGVLDVPQAHLRPTAELAGRLLMPKAVEQLRDRLLAACTPASVVSDLLWAEKHNLTSLVPAFKEYLVRQIQQVVAAAPSELDALTAQSPVIAAEVIRAMVRAATRAGVE